MKIIILTKRKQEMLEKYIKEKKIDVELCKYNKGGVAMVVGFVYKNIMQILLGEGDFYRDLVIKHKYNKGK